MDNPTWWPADGSLPDGAQRYVDWLISLEREPRTKAAFAQEIGVSMSALQKWDHDDRVRKAIDEKANELNMSGVRIQSVINAVYKAAQGGDMNAAKLYLQHVDRLAPKRTIIEDRRISALSDEEMKQELEAAGLLA